MRLDVLSTVVMLRWWWYAHALGKMCSSTRDITHKRRVGMSLEKRVGVVVSRTLVVRYTPKPFAVPSYDDAPSPFVSYRNLNVHHRRHRFSYDSIIDGCHSKIHFIFHLRTNLYINRDLLKIGWNSENFSRTLQFFSYIGVKCSWFRDKYLATTARNRSAVIWGMENEKTRVECKWNGGCGEIE